MAESNNQPKPPPVEVYETKAITPEELRRREAARREALANWEGEGGHLVSNGANNGRKNGT